MNAVKRIARLLAICCVCAAISPAQDATEPRTRKGFGVTIEITNLAMDGPTLALSYSIKNGSQRDLWVCSDIAHVPFEVFLTSDKQTLLIKKRLDVPSKAIWAVHPVGRYVRVIPGTSWAESVRINVPVDPIFLYASTDEMKVAQTVTRLALEIGYYDEDLPALIRSILAVAEKSGLTTDDAPASVLETYFRGLMVRAVLWDFNRVNKDPYGQGDIYLAYNRQALTGEKVLRVEVNGVSIPYRGYSQKAD